MDPREHSPVRLVYLDDSALDRVLVRALLESEGGFETLDAHSLGELKAWLARGGVDVVLSDFHLGFSDGYGVLDLVRRDAPEVPVVIVTGTGSESIAVESLRRGAADYVLKGEPHIRRLATALRSVVEQAVLAKARHGMEARLKENQRMLARALGVGQAGAWISGLKDDKSLWWSPETYRIFGIPEGAPLDMDRFFEAVHPEDRPKIREAVSDSIAQRKAYGLEHRVMRPDGSEIWVREYGDVEWEDGRPARLVGLVQDVTEDHRAREALRASEQRYRALFEQSLAGVFRTLPDGRFLDCNEAMARTLGYGSREELMALNAADLYFERGDRDLYLERLRRDGSVTNYQARLRRKDGGEAWILETVSLLRGEQGHPEILQGTIIDITDRKQVEDALQASEANFRQLVETAANGIFVSMGGCLRYLNPAAAALFGASEPAELEGMPLMDLIHPEDRPVMERRATFFQETGRMLPPEILRVLRRDGQMRWVEFAPSPILYEGVPAARIYAQDITERREAEVALAASEAALKEAQRIARVGSWHTDLGTGATHWSEETFHLLGLEPGSVVPALESFLERMPFSDREGMLAVRDRLMSSREPQMFESRIILPGGEERFLSTHVELALDDQGLPRRIQGTTQDITDRVHSARLSEDRRAINEMVAQNHPTDEILARIARMLESQLRDASASILLAEEGKFRQAAAPSLPKAFIEAMEGLPVGPKVATFGAAFHLNEPIVTEDLGLDPLWMPYRSLALPYGLRACWALPIRGPGGRILGILVVYRREPGGPGRADLDLMSVASHLAAVALEHQLLTERLAHQSQHDPLTGLPNRLLFEDRLRQAMAQARRHQTQVGLLLLGLDRFKQVNDTLGHAAGDEILKGTAQRLSTMIRQSDTLARLGGDEFIIILTDMESAEDALRVAQKALEALQAPFFVDGHELASGASAGISIFPSDGADPGLMLQNAEAAMYRAKARGRNTFQIFAGEMNALAHERLEMESHLRHALDRGELLLHYQPKFTRKGRLHGFEALLRWNRSGLGLVSPAKFIPLAEESGLIVSIGEWVLREACHRAASWQRAGHRDLRVAVNVSTVQFQRPDWADTILRALRDSGLSPEALELEITESLLVQGAAESTENLFKLKDLGVGVAIDDFGTGYSSLSYLHKLPVTTLKIDQSFVRNLGPGREEGLPIVRTIIALAHSLGIQVVAEGVETEAQRDLLLKLGCEVLQGYLLGRPMPEDQATALVEEKPVSRSSKREGKTVAKTKRTPSPSRARSPKAK